MHLEDSTSIDQQGEVPAVDDRKTTLTTPAMNLPERQRGRVGWILLWLLGVPLPVLLALFLLRGCT